MQFAFDPTPKKPAAKTPRRLSKRASRKAAAPAPTASQGSLTTNRSQLFVAAAKQRAVNEHFAELDGDICGEESGEWFGSSFNGPGKNIESEVCTKAKGHDGWHSGGGSTWAPKSAKRKRASNGNLCGNCAAESYSGLEWHWGAGENCAECGNMIGSEDPSFAINASKRKTAANEDGSWDRDDQMDCTKCGWEGTGYEADASGDPTYPYPEFFCPDCGSNSGLQLATSEFYAKRKRAFSASGRTASRKTADRPSDYYGRPDVSPETDAALATLTPADFPHVHPELFDADGVFAEYLIHFEASQCEASMCTYVESWPSYQEKYRQQAREYLAAHPEAREASRKTANSDIIAYRVEAEEVLDAGHGYLHGSGWLHAGCAERLGLPGLTDQNGYDVVYGYTADEVEESIEEGHADVGAQMAYERYYDDYSTVYTADDYGCQFCRQPVFDTEWGERGVSVTPRYASRRKTASVTPGYYLVGRASNIIEGPFGSLVQAEARQPEVKAAAIEYKSGVEDPQWDSMKAQPFPYGLNTVNGSRKTAANGEWHKSTDDDDDVQQYSRSEGGYLAIVTVAQDGSYDWFVASNKNDMVVDFEDYVPAHRSLSDVQQDALDALKSLTATRKTADASDHGESTSCYSGYHEKCNDKGCQCYCHPVTSSRKTANSLDWTRQFVNGTTEWRWHEDGYVCVIEEKEADLGVHESFEYWIEDEDGYVVDSGEVVFRLSDAKQDAHDYLRLLTGNGGR